MKEKESKKSLGGVREDSISDVRPNDLQKGLGGKMELIKKGEKRNKQAESRKESVY